MAQMIKLRRSAVAGRIPTTANLELGELAINVRDGKIFFKRDDNTIQTILTTNTTITGDLTLVGDITGSDVFIDDWGSISGSLAAVQAGHFDPTDVETVYSTVRNTSGGTILKGTPLAVVAGQTSGNLSDVVPADAADPALMPAAFIANEDILDGDEGEAIVFGRIRGINTSAFNSGDKVYVAPGGGWTTTKPVHPNKIQNLGIITKSHATNGGGVVMGAGRSNDVPNLTPGKVWVGTATYPTEATSIHLDEANGRLGVGMTPAQKLDVAGNIRAYTTTGVVNIGTEKDTNYVRLNSDGTSGYISYGSTGGSSRVLRFIGNGSEVARFDISGNFGIGTASPSEKLHVVGDVRIQGNFISLGDTNSTITKSSSLDSFISSKAFVVDKGVTNQRAKLEDTGLYISRTSNGDYSSYIEGANNDLHIKARSDIKFLGNQTTILTIRESNGSVGIGTTAPSHKLHVVNGANTLLVTRDTSTEMRLGIGTANPSYSIELGSYTNGSIGGVKYLYFQDSQRIDGLHARMVYKANRGHYFYPINTNASYDSYGVAIRHLRDSAANTNDDVLLVEKNDGTDLFKVKSSGNVEASGNIEGSKDLTISRTDSTAAVFTLNTNRSFGREFTITNNGQIPQINARDQLLLSADGSNTQIFLDASGLDYIKFVTSAIEQARIDHNGNFGIGTTAPSYKLHVQGAFSNNDLYVNPTSGHTIVGSSQELRLSTTNSADIKIQAGGVQRVAVDGTTGDVSVSNDLNVTGAVTSNGVDVLDNAVAMAIALG